MRSAVSRQAGFYLAALQLLMTVGWTVYVIYLPQLAAQVGIPASAVILLLMLDQAVFTITDLAMGIAADRIARIVGRLGHVVAAVTILSCGAFVALPWVAGAHADKSAFIALALIWAATSSALRAPPLMLLGKYAAQPAIPWLASLALLGFGVAGALAPYLTVALRNVDPRSPFVLSSAALALTCLTLSSIERRLAAPAPEPKEAPKRTLGDLPGRAVVFAAVVAVLAVGFQVHFSIDSARLYLRFAKPHDLESLMPVFWGGFNVAMFAAAPLVARWGGVWVMGAAGLGGGVLAIAAILAGGLSPLLLAQFGTGAAWGIMMMSAVAAALAIGAPGNEGRAVGALYSALAVATLARMGATAEGLAGDPSYGAVLAWTPAAAWLCGGVILLVLARRVGAR
jgi:hypothetical protein